MEKKDFVDVELWFRHEVLSSPREYPELYCIQLAKNKYRFENEKKLVHNGE